MSRSPRFTQPAAWLLLSMLAFASMEYYVAKIWSAGQPQNFSDLYAPWFGARALLVEHRNPYDPSVAHEIQAVIYGAPLQSDNGDAAIAGGFAYPLYAAFLLWPSVHLPFSTVRIIFFFGSLSASLASLILWLRVLRFSGPFIELITITFFTMGSFPILQVLRLQNLSVIAAAFLALSIMLLRSQHLALAGICLAVSTFKPQFTVVLAPWLALWIARDWRRRQSLAWSFLTALALLLGLSEWLLPNWTRDFLNVVRAYREYTFGRSLLDVWFTPLGGSVAAAVLLLVVTVLSWRVSSSQPNSRGFFLAMSLVLAATLTVIPTLAPHAQLLLLPGFLYLYRDRALLRGSARPVRMAIRAPWVLLGWQWTAAMILTAIFASHPGALPPSWRFLPLYTSPLLPLAVVVALSCLIRLRPWHNDALADPLSQ